MYLLVPMGLPVAVSRVTSVRRMAAIPKSRSLIPALAENDRCRQRVQRTCVRDALVWSVSVVELFELAQGVE
jgi:hypothetical protein